MTLYTTAVQRVPDTYVVFRFDGTQQSIDDVNAWIGDQAALTNDAFDLRAEYLSPTGWRYTADIGGPGHTTPIWTTYGLDEVIVLRKSPDGIVGVDGGGPTAAVEVFWTWS